MNSKKKSPVKMILIIVGILLGIAILVEAIGALSGGSSDSLDESANPDPDGYRHGV